MESIDVACIAVIAGSFFFAGDRRQSTARFDGLPEIAEWHCELLQTVEAFTGRGTLTRP
jgi:hypothetical protein